MPSKFQACNARDPHCGGVSARVIGPPAVCYLCSLAGRRRYALAAYKTWRKRRYVQVSNNIQRWCAGTDAKAGHGQQLLLHGSAPAGLSKRIKSLGVRRRVLRARRQA